MISGYSFDFTQKIKNYWKLHFAKALERLQETQFQSDFRLNVHLSLEWNFEEWVGYSQVNVAKYLSGVLFHWMEN